jgi:hypothetical protein
VIGDLAIEKRHAFWGNGSEAIARALREVFNQSCAVGDRASGIKPFQSLKHQVTTLPKSLNHKSLNH